MFQVTPIMGFFRNILFCVYPYFETCIAQLSCYIYLFLPSQKKIKDRKPVLRFFIKILHLQIIFIS